MTPLPQRQLGHSGMFITPVDIGTAPLASTLDWNIYCGAQDEADGASWQLSEEIKDATANVMKIWQP
jgi:hypothetical protein